MTDNLLFALIIETLSEGILDYSLSVSISIQKDYQPQQMGANTGPTLYIHKISDHRYGSPLKKDVWNELTSEMNHTEETTLETVFQLTARVIEDPNDPTCMTSGDLIAYASSILQSDAAMSKMGAQGVSFYRITDIRNTFIINDENRNESAPSFDFTAVHTRSLVTKTPILEIINPGIHRV